jgi:hypothetical protein
LIAVPGVLVPRLRGLPPLAAICAAVTCPMAGAGAQGPMQFMPATWAIYGHGSIHRPRNAILAAGRFLAARGWVLLPAGYGVDPAVRVIPVRT